MLLLQQFLQSFLTVVLREDSSEVLDLSFWLQVVPDGGTDGGCEVGFRWEYSCNGLGDEVLPIGLKASADLSMQELQSMTRGNSFLLYPFLSQCLEAVDVVHNKCKSINGPWHQVLSAEGLWGMACLRCVQPGED